MFSHQVMSPCFKLFDSIPTLQQHDPQPHPHTLALQVAEQQGRYLAGVLNEEAKPPAASSGVTRKPPSEFVYKHLGSMASMGGASAILDIGVSKGRR